MTVTLLKKTKSFAVLMVVFCFLAAASLSSCGNQGNESSTDSAEEKVEGSVENAEHPEGEAVEEHPAAEEGEEHPSSDEDKEKKDEHPE